MDIIIHTENDKYIHDMEKIFFPRESTLIQYMAQPKSDNHTSINSVNMKKICY